MRILLVSQMYPGPEAPDLGVFVRQLELALEARGHELDRAVLDSRSGGTLRHLALARHARRAARRRHPDVVYAHFLVPTGLTAALVGGAPLVVTAHGQDVANVGRYPGVRAATRFVARRSAAVIAVSDYLRRELEAKVPEARGKTSVIDSGVDLERFRPRDAEGARAELGWDTAPPRFLCVGSLTERKNVVRLADAFATVGTGSLAFVGDGPLRSSLEGRAGVRVVGAVPHERVPLWLAAADVVCQPSTLEPFGQAVLEALASGRPVVATRVGGPPEFVTPETGVLVDPLDVTAIAAGLRAVGLRAVAALPAPGEAARAVAAEHGLDRQAERVEEVLLRAAGRR